MIFLQQQYVHLMKVSLLKFPVQGVLPRVAIDLVNSFVRSVSCLTFAFGTYSGPDFTWRPLSVKPTPRPLLSLSVLLQAKPGPCADCEPGARGAAGAGAVSLRTAESLTPDFIFQISETPHYFGKATGHRRLMTASLKPNCSQSL